MKIKNEEGLFRLIQEAKTNPKKQLESDAKDINKSEHISPLDACTCTGNCSMIN